MISNKNAVIGHRKTERELERLRQRNSHCLTFFGELIFCKHDNKWKEKEFCQRNKKRHRKPKSKHGKIKHRVTVGTFYSLETQVSTPLTLMGVRCVCREGTHPIMTAA